MKRALTQQHLKRHPEKLDRFDKVRIWSGEHHYWWRPEGRGYTGKLGEAGVYSVEDAWDYVKHCGTEKRIKLVGLAPGEGVWA
jgi:hypothetical protein